MKISTSNERIRTLINELGITQTEFCKRTKITKSALSNYLNRDRTARQDQLIKIADVYGVEPGWLMGLDVPMFKELPEDSRFSTLLSDPINRELLLSADGCTNEQKHIAISTLKAFKESNTNFKETRTQMKESRKTLKQTRQQIKEARKQINRHRKTQKEV